MLLHYNVARRPNTYSEISLDRLAFELCRGLGKPTWDPFCSHDISCVNSAPLTDLYGDIEGNPKFSGISAACIRPSPSQVM